MASQSGRRSLIERFFDAFLQEQNIKWLLGLGMLILLGSSTMLVTTHWQTYPPLWKYAVLLGYTGLIHAAGQFAWHRLALRRTGAGLMALTVLLIPLICLALRWVHPDGDASLASIANQSGLVGLLGVTAVFASLASRRIFRLCLRRDQPTFLLAYLLLAFSGAVVPSLPVAWAPILALALWAIFAIGTIKVNRHVFWLTEEERRPRIFGFFPILLLGGQFLLLYVTCHAAHLPWHWTGLGLVLTAMPMLLAADALARVVQERGTGLAQRLPAAIAIPLFVGLAATIAGVVLSGVGYPQTVAIVPTALLAAVSLGVAARRTGNSPLTWVTLLLVMVAYQTCPAFCKELVREVVHTGAAAVNEQKLPWAFYGLTYLPLIAVFTVASIWLKRRGELLFSGALRQFAVGLPVLLLPISLTHPKALFPVGIALGAVLVTQLFAFRLRALLPGVAAAVVIASLGATPFVEGVLGLHVGTEFPLLAVIAGSAVLLWPGMWLDRASLKFIDTDTTDPLRGADVCRWTSIAMLLCLVPVWIATAALHSLFVTSGMLILAGLLIHAAVGRQSRLAVAGFAFGIVLSAFVMHRWDWSWSTGLAVLAAELAILSGGGRWGIRVTVESRRRHFASAATQVATAGIVLSHCLFVPLLFTVMLWNDVFPAWIAVGISLIVGIDLAIRRGGILLVVSSWLLLLGMTGAAFVTYMPVDDGLNWVPAVWSIVTGIVLLGRSQLRALTVGNLERASTSFVATLDGCLAATWLLLAVFTLPLLPASLRLGGFLATACGWMWAVERRRPWRSLVLMIFNLQLVAGLLHIVAPDAAFAMMLTWTEWSAAALPVALLSAVSGSWWMHREQHCRELSGVPSRFWQAVSSACLASLLPLPGADFSVIHALLATLTFFILAGQQVARALLAWRDVPDDVRSDALRTKIETPVWLAEMLLAVGVGYLAAFQVIPLNSIGMLFGSLFAATAAWGCSRWAARGRVTNILARPLELTSLALPAVAILLGLWRHVSLVDPAWLGLNSLALLLAGGFYFWRGLERREAASLVASAVVLNLSLAMLWRELSWTDPQLFLVPVGLSVIALVELLRQQFPEKLHDPLRYAGALCILVSPTFHIVGGSWLHLGLLMILSVGIVVLAMGLRVRALMYTGAAFLVADLVAMVVRSGIDHPGRLWIVGVLFGAAVIALAAWCERHRESMLQRMRLLAAELETWK